MAQAEILIPFVKSWEGGFSNHPNDKGGPTNKGITLVKFREVYGQGKTVEDLKMLTEAQWWFVFKTRFWDLCQADKIENQSIANLLVDWSWTSGKTGIRFAQQVLNVAADGVVGPRTLAAINLNDASTVFKAVWKRRREHFEALSRLPGQGVFLAGWMKRLNGLKWDRLVCNTERKYMGRKQQKVVTWSGGILTEGWEDKI